MSISILGIGAVSALGCGIESIKAGLTGRVTPLIKKYKTETIFSDGEAGLKAYTAAIVGLDRFVPRSALRRIDRFIQMALLSSYLAVEDSGVDFKDRTRVGIVFGSGYGPLQTTFNFLDTLIDFGDKCASPTLFANSVHNSLASQTSILLKIQGPSLTLTCFEQTTASVISVAEAWLGQGTVDYVLAGVGDEYCAMRGYAAAFLSGGTGAATINPLRFDECSYIPGEGFVTLVLGKACPEKAYCTLACSADGPEKHEVVFLAANGDRGTGRLYEPLVKGDNIVRVYSHLYGSMPTGNIFDIAIAALSLREGTLYSSSSEEESELLSGYGRISCVGYDAAGNASMFTLSK